MSCTSDRAYLVLVYKYNKQIVSNQKGKTIEIEKWTNTNNIWDLLRGSCRSKMSINTEWSPHTHPPLEKVGPTPQYQCSGARICISTSGWRAALLAQYKLSQVLPPTNLWPSISWMFFLTRVCFTWGHQQKHNCSYRNCRKLNPPWLTSHPHTIPVCDTHNPSVWNSSPRQGHKSVTTHGCVDTDCVVSWIKEEHFSTKSTTSHQPHEQDVLS